MSTDLLLLGFVIVVVGMGIIVYLLNKDSYKSRRDRK